MVFFVALSTASVRAGLQLFLSWANLEVPAAGTCLLVTALSTARRCAPVRGSLRYIFKHSSPSVWLSEADGSTNTRCP